MASPEKTIFYSIEKAIKSYRQFAQKNLSAKGFDITIDQGMILNIIKDNPGIAQHVIAEKAFKDDASVTRIIENMVAKGALKRNFHALDRRRFELTLTADGLKLLQQIKPTVEANRRRAVTGISDREVAILRRMLDRITENCNG